MQYSITYAKSAAKALKKIHPTERKRILKAITGQNGLVVNPRPREAIQLTGGHGEYRIKVGNYRIIYEIEDDCLVILVLRIGHRREVYR